MIKFLSFILPLVLLSCGKDSNHEESQNNKFSDPVIQEIYQNQDERNSEGLLTFLSSENYKYRREASLAFASVQDSIAIEPLVSLLEDTEVEVRISAAYALGQIGNIIAERPIIRALEEEEVPIVRKELWEALGKCSSEEGLRLLESGQPQDSLEKSGLAWGIYRAGIKGNHSNKIIKKATELLDFRNSFETRLGAAHFLYRTKDIDISPFFELIAESAKNDPAPNVRMASVGALAKVNSLQCAEVLSQILSNDVDYRVRVNSIKAMSGKDYQLIKETVWKALKDENKNTAISAANYLLNQPEFRGDEAYNLAKTMDNWRVRSILLSAALKNSPDKNAIMQFIIELYDNSTNPYEQAALLISLGQVTSRSEYISEKTFSTNHKVISTSGLRALANIRSLKDFPESMEGYFADLFKKAIGSNDLALIGIAGGILRNAEFGFKEIFEDFNFLYEAKNGLSLPKDNEALQALQRTIDYFENTEIPQPVVNEYNHPIDWEIVKSIPADQKVIVETTKGNIHLELIIEESPGSTLNFISLANNGYYDGKNFHRVVPNFVIQGGCPRGDGWGGENYSIRSELGMPRYRDGYVGMASAGKDTEGVQWFITHSPTPHLDGSYSIFGKVVKGMEVVHGIKVGDTIISVTVL